MRCNLVKSVGGNEMKREFLKKLGLTDEQIDSVMNENGKDINTAKGEFETLKADKTKLEGELKTANTTITDLKKNNGDNEALQTKVKEYEDSIKTLKAEHEAEVTKLARDGISAELMSKYKAKNNVAVKAIIGDIEAKDSETYKTLLESKLKALSEADDTKFLFGEPQTKTLYDPPKGGAPTGNNPFAKDTYNLTEQGKLLRDNPEQAKAFAEAAGVQL